MRAPQKNNIHQTISLKPDTIPVYGKVQSYFLRVIPSFSFLSMPEYLFEEDTLDKVAKNELEPILNNFQNVIDTAMYMPTTWLKHIDRQRRLMKKQKER